MAQGCPHHNEWTELLHNIFLLANLTLPNFPRSFVHITHLWMILLTTTLAPSTQIPFFLRLFKVNPLPPWPIVSWLQITTASIMLLVFGTTTGCASLLVSLDWLSLPPTHNRPLLSRKGSSMNELLDRLTPLVLCVPELRAFTSSGNDFLCIILNMTVAAFSNISTFSGFDYLSNVSFLIFFIHWFLAKVTIAITLFIFNQFRVSASNLEMTSSLILARLTLTPFFSSGSLSVICVTALSPLNQISLHDQRN